MKKFYTLLGRPSKKGRHYQLTGNDSVIIETFHSKASIESILEKRIIPKGYVVDKIMRGKVFDKKDSVDIGVMLIKES
jgi:hypothetical protein